MFFLFPDENLGREREALRGAVGWGVEGAEVVDSPEMTAEKPERREQFSEAAGSFSRCGGITATRERRRNRQLTN